MSQLILWIAIVLGALVLLPIIVCSIMMLWISASVTIMSNLFDQTYE